MLVSIHTFFTTYNDEEAKLGDSGLTRLVGSWVKEHVTYGTHIRRERLQTGSN